MTIYSIDVYKVLDLIGTFVFAISGIRVAADKKMDIFGAIVIGFSTAIGGGTLRDIILGATPVAWLQDKIYFWVIVAAVAVGIFLDKYIVKLQKALSLFDSLGLGLFTIYGYEKALAFGLHEGLAIMMGIMSATAGGVIRDILANEIPIILRREIYATACFAGAFVYMGLKYMGVGFGINAPITILLVLIIRTVAVKYKLSFPEIKL